MSEEVVAFQQRAVASHTGMLFTSEVSCALVPASQVAAAAPSRDKNRMANGNEQKKQTAPVAYGE